MTRQQESDKAWEEHFELMESSGQGPFNQAYLAFTRMGFNAGYLAGFKKAVESDIEDLNAIISSQRAGGIDTGSAEICRNALIRKLDE